MKKILSIVLSVVMALTAFMPFSAYAVDYDLYNLHQGKKKGEILGYYQTNIDFIKRIEGSEEVVSLVQQSEEKVLSALGILRTAFVAITEVEKDKVELEALLNETSISNIGISEGLGSSMGDPSACARDLDVIHAAGADVVKASVEAPTAGTGPYSGTDTRPKNFMTAHYAVYEYFDMEEVFYKWHEAGGPCELYYANRDDLLGIMERAVKFRAKAEEDVNKANKLLDEAEAVATEGLLLQEEAREKALEIAANATTQQQRSNFENIASILNHTNELRADIGLDHWERVSIDFTEFDGSSTCGIQPLERVLFFNLFRAREAIVKLVSQFFVKTNDLTYNGKEQTLVSLGKDVYLPDGEKVLFALGEKPKLYDNEKDFSDENLNGVVFYDFSGKNYAPEDSAFTEKLPEAKEAGTYYVYAKFPTGEKIVVTAEIKKPAPTVTKKDNTLFAKGKTVKLKASKLKKKGRSVKRKKAITVNSAVGAVTYSKAKGNKKISVDKKTGNIKIKKGLKKGKYKVTVNVTAAGNNQYKSVTKPVTVKIVVK